MAKTGPKRQQSEIPEFSSMQQMASATGIPLSILAMAKKSGCMFVRHGRCDLATFLRWFFSRDIDPDEDVNWIQRDKRAAALIRECKLEEMRKQTFEFALAEKFVRKLVSQLFFGELDRLAQEFPANLKGKTEIEIHGECLRQNEQVKRNLRKELESWIEVTGPKDK